MKCSLSIVLRDIPGDGLLCPKEFGYTFNDTESDLRYRLTSDVKQLYLEFLNLLDEWKRNGFPFFQRLYKYIWNHESRLRTCGMHVFDAFWHSSKLMLIRCRLKHLSMHLFKFTYGLLSRLIGKVFNDIVLKFLMLVFKKTRNKNK